MIDNCPTQQNLSAYHDNELTRDERATLARHLAWCEACARQLQQLVQMSSFITSGAPDGMSQIALKRLHKKLDEVMERGLVRWAWEVSGIAASILLIGSIWLTQLKDPATATAGVPPWVGAQSSVDPVVQVAPTPAAAWYLADARNATDIAPQNIGGE